MWLAPGSESSRVRISAEATLTPRGSPVLQNLVIHIPVSQQVEGIHSLLHNWQFVMVSGEQWLFSRDHDGGGLVTKSYLTLVTSWTTACQAPVHGTSHSRILVWVAISFSRGSSWPGIKPGFPALQVVGKPYSRQHGSHKMTQPGKEHQGTLTPRQRQC